MTSVQEAQAQLEAAREAEKQAAKQAETERREQAKRQAKFESVMEPRVEALERRVAEARSVPIDDGIAPLQTRRTARAYLHGSLGNRPDLWSAEEVVANLDGVAGQFLGLGVEILRMLEQLTDYQSDVWLPGNHALVRRTDVLEVTCWGEFIARVQVLAGE